MDPASGCAACTEARADQGLSGLDLAVERAPALIPLEVANAGPPPMLQPEPSVASGRDATAFRAPPRSAPPPSAETATPSWATPPRAPAPLVGLREVVANAAPPATPPRFSSRFEYDTPFVNGVTIPAALVTALLVTLVVGPLVFLTVGMWTHELGHAIVSWLTGIPAIPMPFVTFQIGEDRSTIVIVLVALGWIALGAWGIKKRSPGLISGALGIAALQLVLTGIMSPGRANQWVLFAGLGGELVLSTVVMLAFYVRLPLRWDFWRYPVVFTCAFAYVHALVLWVKVALGVAEMPHGAFAGDSSEGDVERLLRTHEFTMASLARTYLWLAVACGAVLAVVYLRMLRKARKLEASGAHELEEETES